MSEKQKFEFPIKVRKVNLPKVQPILKKRNHAERHDPEESETLETTKRIHHSGISVS